jgi:hypothetical protein
MEIIFPTACPEDIKVVTRDLSLEGNLHLLLEQKIVLNHFEFM